MKLTTVNSDGRETAAIWTPQGVLLLETLKRQYGQTWPTEMLPLIQSGQLPKLQEWYQAEVQQRPEALMQHVTPVEQVQFAPLYRTPSKIWGIGLNYREHAADLSEKTPTTEPASFMKPDTTIIGDQETIQIPVQSQRTTAEAELGVIIGTRCKDVAREHWRSVVAGFTTIIDMTAEDILRKNPRYLTMSKSFDTFFSVGPLLLTPDEIDDVMALQVSTVINGRVHASNRVANMTFPPDFLVAFHSEIMTLLPGDIISTGTPGATPIQEGDTVECRIDGFESLVNPVKDLKT
ncbi:fumarylacetoacetate hydrolase [candidate division KSB3 bacterium]|uniref:Fumarylacetoacetate hydrolase n=1 Tax=candidate division KSB3 bacterium TaxID=2044937 RepID=A0A9D5JWM9_9BACT|nr:fumarylacetoacetate hydrolase [candidate division KSB3 bacterium]MBD3325652.1 fumarylacetoacetate hydrolase [candidate division KSB3 bacterium]